MFFVYLINAVIGAFIGFITNWLAIKMLFKPSKPLYIGKFRLPFTPGIIPKEKARLANSIGTVIGNKLLTGDVLEKALKDEEINGAVDKLIDNTVKGLEENQSTLRDTLALIVEDKDTIDGIVCDAAGRYFKAAVQSDETKQVIKDLLNKMATEFMATPIKRFENDIHFSDWADKGIGFAINLVKNEGFVDKLEHQMVHFIEKESNNPSPLSSILPDQFFDSVKHTVSQHTDSIGEIVTGLLDNPQIEKNVLDILNGLMDTSVTTRVLNIFVSKDAVYKRIKQKIEKYVKSDKGKQELARVINEQVDKLKETRVGDLVKRANREDVYPIVGSMLRLAVRSCLDAKFNEMLSGQIRKYITDHPDITLGKLLEPLAKGEIPYEKLIEDLVEFILCNYADKWVDELVNLAVPRLLDQKISRFAALLNGYRKNLGSSITRILFSFILPKSDEIIKAVNIPKLITDKVNEYDITELEEMILSIIDRELKVIIHLGAVFGFIIGLAGPLFSGLLMK